MLLNHFVGALDLFYFWAPEIFFMWTATSRTPWVVKGNKLLGMVWFKWGSQAASLTSSFMWRNLPLVKWLLGQWGILKHIPQRETFIAVYKLVTIIRYLHLCNNGTMYSCWSLKAQTWQRLHIFETVGAPSLPSGITCSRRWWRHRGKTWQRQL